METHGSKTPPVGTVAMLFTDIQGSTRLAHELGGDWPGVLADHRSLVRKAIADAGGYVEGTEGDSFFATFEEASAGVSAAVAAQRALRSHPWPEQVGELRVRMGLHCGMVEHTDGHYVGLEVHRAARVGAAAGGGQVLLTAAARSLVHGELSTEDLGWHRLKDFPDPTRLFHLIVHEDRPASAFPAPRTLDVRPTNLPPDDRPLIGRTAEQAAICSAFLEDGTRLLTLTGLGGVGKTTTALAAARSLLERFAGGVWLVRADSLRSKQELLQAIAEQLHVRDAPGVELHSAIAERLEGSEFLVVLDNLEQVEGAGEVVAELLARTPGLAILATSRSQLHLATERLIALGPMPADDAVGVFIRRAREADPSLSLDDPETREAVEEISRRLDGLPLALELAAARVRLMSPRQLLDRLGSALDLRSSAADLPERQRSVRATVDWTLGLLSEDAQQLFARLAVFSGQAPLDLIEKVCGPDLDVLEAAAALLDFSLLRRAGSGLELVAALREVATERLVASGEEDAMRRAHAEAMVEIAGSVRFSAVSQREALELAESLHADTWAAAAWARTADPRLHRALVVNMSAWWAWQGRLRGSMEAVAAALEGDEIDAIDRGELLLARGYLLLLAGRSAEALADVEAANRLLTDRSNFQRAADLHVKSMALAMVGRLDEAITVGRAEVFYHRKSGSRDRLVLGLASLAQTLIQSGDAASAGPFLDEAEALAEGSETISALGLPNIRGDWFLAMGEPARALAGYAQSLTHSQAGSGEFTSFDIAGIVLALEKIGEPAAALEVAAALELTAAEWGTDLSTFSVFEGGVPAAIERARAVLSPEKIAAAEAQGHALPAGARATRALALAQEISARV